MKIAVVIPSFKVSKHILSVIKSIGPEVSRIYVVDDCCPEFTGRHVIDLCHDERVSVIWHPVNLGVGGAVLTGYQAAIDDRCEVIVKVDGDGQMDPNLINLFVEPLLSGEADYAKGNRFYNLANIGLMPPLRVMGNAVLSFMTKLSSGYWSIFDPTNGFTAIHAKVAQRLPFEKISKRYFFETDMLFRLNLLRAAVVDIPMDAKYGDEVSNLKITRVIPEFLGKHVKNFYKRIFYNYFLRDFSLASIELFFGVTFLSFGLIYGMYHWYQSNVTLVNSPTGTVMLAALTTLLGTQLLLGFLAYDIQSVPSKCIHRSL